MFRNRSHKCPPVDAVNACTPVRCTADADNMHFYLGSLMARATAWFEASKQNNEAKESFLCTRTIGHYKYMYSLLKNSNSHPTMFQTTINKLLVATLIVLASLIVGVEASPLPITCPQGNSCTHTIHAINNTEASYQSVGCFSESCTNDTCQQEVNWDAGCNKDENFEAADADMGGRYLLENICGLALTVLFVRYHTRCCTHDL